MTGEDVSAVAAIGAVLAGLASIAVTVFNWLTSRDYGTTVRDMVGPTNLAITQSAAGLAETNGLMRTLLEQYGGSLERLTSEQRNCSAMLARLDERTAKLDELL